MQQQVAVKMQQISIESNQRWENVQQQITVLPITWTMVAKILKHHIDMEMVWSVNLYF